MTEMKKSSQELYIDPADPSPFQETFPLFNVSDTPKIPHVDSYIKLDHLKSANLSKYNDHLNLDQERSSTSKIVSTTKRMHGGRKIDKIDTIQHKLDDVTRDIIEFIILCGNRNDGPYVSLNSLESAFRKCKRHPHVHIVPNSEGLEMMATIENYLEKIGMAPNKWFKSIVKTQARHFGDSSTTNAIATWTDIKYGLRTLCNQAEQRQWPDEKILRLIYYLDPICSGYVTDTDFLQSFNYIHTTNETDALKKAGPRILYILDVIRQKQMRIKDLFQSIDTEKNNRVSIELLAQGLKNILKDDHKIYSHIYEQHFHSTPQPRSHKYNPSLSDTSSLSDKSSKHSGVKSSFSKHNYGQCHSPSHGDDEEEDEEGVDNSRTSSLSSGIIIISPEEQNMKLPFIGGTDSGNKNLLERLTETRQKLEADVMHDPFVASPVRENLLRSLRANRSPLESSLPARLEVEECQLGKPSKNKSKLKSEVTFHFEKMSSLPVTDSYEASDEFDFEFLPNSRQEDYSQKNKSHSSLASRTSHYSLADDDHSRASGHSKEGYNSVTSSLKSAVTNKTGNSNGSKSFKTLGSTSSNLSRTRTLKALVKEETQTYDYWVDQFDKKVEVYLHRLSKM